MSFAKKGKCYYCRGKATGRYKTIEGRYRLVCKECLNEARNGKYGFENKKYSVGYNLNEGFSDFGLG